MHIHGGHADGADDANLMQRLTRLGCLLAVGCLLAQLAVRKELAPVGLAMPVATADATGMALAVARNRCMLMQRLCASTPTMTSVAMTAMSCMRRLRTCNGTRDQV